MSYRESLEFFKLRDLYTKEELEESYHKLLKEKPVINIDVMYSILLNELNKRVLKEKIALLKDNINKLKEKYSNTKIVYLCNSFEAKLKYITNTKDLDKVKNDFNEKVSILKQQIIVPREKINTIESVKKHLTDASIDLKNIILEYIDKITVCDTLEEINKIKQKYDKMLKAELIQEKLREKELDNLKISLKKSEIYNFYINAKELNIEGIINAHNLLIASLNLCNMVTFTSRDFICKLVSEFDYLNPENSFDKINLYLKSNNFTLDNYDDKLVKIAENNINHKYIDLILDKYYLYATKKKESIDKIVKDKDNFKELFILLNSIKEGELKKIIPYIDNISYKNIKVLLESLNDFKNPNNIYVERTSGRICVVKETTKKIYTVFLDGEVKNDLGNSNDIIWKYISLTKFFNLAQFTNGLEITAQGSNDTYTLGDYNINYLYYTNELILCLVDDGEKKYFKFLPNNDDYKFVIGENTQITRNDYFDLYKDKTVCLNDFVDFINNPNKLNNLVYEKIR